mmetsp:Transcript_60628/g.180572  ORF Transcript_60628/g.180572 Transcript_60628/m.180572 type:complete len:108 (-) Transcript_60628:94-417(-)
MQTKEKSTWETSAAPHVNVITQVPKLDLDSLTQLLGPKAVALGFACVTFRMASSWEGILDLSLLVELAEAAPRCPEMARSSDSAAQEEPARLGSCWAEAMCPISGSC